MRPKNKLESQVEVYKTVVRPAMVYGAEKWAVKKAQEKKLECGGNEDVTRNDCKNHYDENRCETLLMVCFTKHMLSRISKIHVYYTFHRAHNSTITYLPTC